MADGPGTRRRHRARCDVCGDVIESEHPWDSVTCSCGLLTLSGGPERRQILWRARPGASWTDLGDATAPDGGDEAGPAGGDADGESATDPDN